MIIPDGLLESLINLIFKDIEFDKKITKILIQIIIFINIKLNTQYSLKEKFSTKQSKNLPNNFMHKINAI